MARWDHFPVMGHMHWKHMAWTMTVAGTMESAKQTRQQSSAAATRQHRIRLIDMSSLRALKSSIPLLLREVLRSDMAIQLTQHHHQYQGNNTLSSVFQWLFTEGMQSPSRTP